MSSVKWNPRFVIVVENDMSLCLSEREVQLNFLCAFIWTHKVTFRFSSFNCNCCYIKNLIVMFINMTQVKCQLIHKTCIVQI